MLHWLGTRTRNHKFDSLQIGLLTIVGLGLRFVNLGYSDFQGDEIKAICSLSQFDTRGQFLLYLLDQRKGPVQFLITCVYGIFDPAFSSELALRLPFAIANFAAMAIFFVLARRLFTRQTAIYSTFLFATNGVIVAFARIVQYQSFVILGVVIGILGLTQALLNERWRVLGLYLGLTAAACAILTHFDAAFVLPPMALLVWHWWKKFHRLPEFNRLRLHLFFAAAIASFLVLAFYIEYAIRLGPHQLDYWNRRLTGEPSNTIQLFQFYNPGPVLWICLGSVAIGLTRIRRSIGWQVVLTWLLPPLVFMEIIFKSSRTHAYTYFLPLMIVAGLGLETLIAWLRRYLRGRSIQIAPAIVLSVLLVFGYISYQVLVDHDPEYPWYPKRVLTMDLPGGPLTGTFGFPYSRKWRAVGDWVERLPAQDKVMATNEKQEIAEFYLPSNVRFRYGSGKLPQIGEMSDGIYYLLIDGPQSWQLRLWGWPLERWHEELIPLQEFANDEGRTVASIYYLTPDEIDAYFR